MTNIVYFEFKAGLFLQGTALVLQVEAHVREDKIRSIRLYSNDLNLHIHPMTLPPTDQDMLNQYIWFHVDMLNMEREQVEESLWRADPENYQTVKELNALNGWVRR